MKLPTKLLVSILVVTLAPSLWGADKAKLKASYEAKNSKGFVSAVQWHRSFSDAKAAAKDKFIPIVAYFTRSDQRSPLCDRIEDDMLIDDAWKSMAKECVPYLNIRSGLRDTPDIAISERYGETTYPVFRILNSRGVELFEFHPFKGSQKGSIADRLERDVEDAKILLVNTHLAEGGRIGEVRPDKKKAKARLTILRMIREFRGADANAKQLKSALKRLKKKASESDQELIARGEQFLEELPFREIRAQYVNRVEKARKAQNLPEVEAANKAVAEQCYRLFRKGTALKNPAGDFYFEFWAWTTEGALFGNDKRSAKHALEKLLKAPRALKSKRVQDLQKRVNEG